MYFLYSMEERGETEMKLLLACMCQRRVHIYMSVTDMCVCVRCVCGMIFFPTSAIIYDVDFIKTREIEGGTGGILLDFLRASKI